MFHVLRVYVLQRIICTIILFMGVNSISAAVAHFYSWCFGHHFKMLVIVRDSV